MSVSLSDMARTGGSIRVTTDDKSVGCEVPSVVLASAFAAIERRFAVGGGRRDRTVSNRVMDATLAVIRARPGDDLTPEEAHIVLWYAFNGPSEDTLRLDCMRSLRTTGKAGLHMFGDGGGFGIRKDETPRKQDGQVTGRQVAHATLAADKASGAGYPVDRYLRVILDDYVSRLLQDGPSFEGLVSGVAFAPFLERRDFAGSGGPTFAAARLRPEKDHAFDLGDFLDATVEDVVRDGGLDVLARLREGVVHSYSPLSPKSRTLSDATATVAIGGFSCVRHGQRLSWFMLGGPIRDLDAETALLRGVQAHRESDALGVAPSDLRAVALEGMGDVWANVIWGVFDLAARKHIARGLTSEVGQTVDIRLDQPNEGLDPLSDHILRRVPVELMVDAAVACFGLPAYFAHRVDVVAEERRATRLSGGALDPDLTDRIKAADDDRKLHIRIVRTLHPVRAPRAIPEGKRKFTPPRYLVVVEPHWRRLPEGSIGKDQDDRPILGRTWVRLTEKYTDNPRRPRVIHVKQPVMPVHAALDGSEAVTDEPPPMRR